MGKHSPDAKRSDKVTVLAILADVHEDNPARPASDAKTTLSDWIESGIVEPTAHFG